MRVAFVFPDFNPLDARSYSLGIGSLAAVLRAAGHEPSLMHYTRPVGQDRFVADLRARRPDLVAFSATSHSFPHVARWADWAKGYGPLTTVCGGTHATIAPEDAARAGGLDALCVGEGEGALLDLCEAVEAGRRPGAIPNLWQRREGGVERSPVRPLLRDLDALPFPDTEVFDYAQLEPLRKGVAPVMASRGCDRACSYCCNRRIREVYGGDPGYVRFRSVGHVIENIRELRGRYPFIRYISFLDDILPLRREWFREFAAEYRRSVGLPFRAKCRPDLLDEERASLLREAGCEHVKLGVESGNESVRREILRRRITDEELRRAFELCRRHGLRTTAYNMVGVPSENLQAVLDTIRLNAALRPDRIMRSIYYPYPYTELHEVCRTRGYLTGRTLDSYRETTVLRLPGLAEAEIRFLYEAFGVLVRLYRGAAALPGRAGRLAVGALDAVVASPALPRGLLASTFRAAKGALQAYRRRRFW